MFFLGERPTFNTLHALVCSITKPIVLFYVPCLGFLSFLRPSTFILAGAASEHPAAPRRASASLRRHPSCSAGIVIPIPVLNYRSWAAFEEVVATWSFVFSISRTVEHDSQYMRHLTE